MKRPEKTTSRRDAIIPTFYRSSSGCTYLRRDLPCVGQLDRVHGQRVAAVSA